MGETRISKWISDYEIPRNRCKPAGSSLVFHLTKDYHDRLRLIADKLKLPVSEVARQFVKIGIAEAEEALAKRISEEV